MSESVAPLTNLLNSSFSFLMSSSSSFCFFIWSSCLRFNSFISSSVKRISNSTSRILSLCRSVWFWNLTGSPNSSMASLSASTICSRVSVRGSTVADSVGFSGVFFLSLISRRALIFSRLSLSAIDSTTVTCCGCWTSSSSPLSSSLVSGFGRPFQMVVGKSSGLTGFGTPPQTSS